MALRYSACVATKVLPSPVFISAMSPSWRTMPPISCTSKRRTPIVRLKASRTAAKLSKRSSSSDSPFAKRSRNSTVFAASSASLSFSKSGSSVLMYCACCLARLRRRPSPTRRTFSNAPSCWAISQPGYRLKPVLLDLPEVGVEPRSTDDGVSLHVLELLAVALHATDVDLPRCDRPTGSLLPATDRPVRRFQVLLDRVGERREVGVALLLGHDQVAFGKCRKLDGIAGDVRRLARHVDVP